MLQQHERLHSVPMLHFGEVESDVASNQRKPEEQEKVDAAAAAIYSTAVKGIDQDGNAKLAPGVSPVASITGSVSALLLLGVACGLSGCARATPSPTDDEDDVGKAPPLARYLAEFLGSFFLVFSVGCNVLRGNATWGVASIASTLTVSIYALGAVSGANFNPAVSLALGLARAMPPREVVTYICLQLAAGITASLAYGVMLGETFPLKPAATGFAWWQVGLAEMFYTFMLCFVVLNVCVSKRHAGKEQFYGLAIGFVIVAGGYSAGTISGGCFNPAVALAIEVSTIAASEWWSPLYIAFEVLGAALAAALFRVCRPADCEDDPELQYPLLSRLVSEFLGAFMLVLTVGLSVIGASKAAVFAIASSLMCMIFALGSVSGAHFNPAVTVAIVCSGRDLLSWGNAVAYIGAQLAGGAAGAFTYVVIENWKTVPLGPARDLSAALFGEFLFTFLLAFVVLAVATVKSPLSQYFGFAIGSCVMAGGLAIGQISGGSLNPAVSFGLALSDYAVRGGSSLMYAAGYSMVELCAGAFAAVAFAVTYPRELDMKA